MKRQQFIAQCGMACLGSLALGSLLEGCASLAPIEASLEDNRIKIPVSAFATERDGTTKWKRHVVVRHTSVSHPIVVVRSDDGQFTSLLLGCTHQGNELTVVGDLITCSAHGSEFALTGQVLQGPADQRLRTFPTTATLQFIYIEMA